MSTFRKPDFIYFVAAAVASGAICVVLIYFGQGTWAPSLGIVFAAFVLVWLAPWHQLNGRLWAYKWYYRFFGPLCTITIYANIKVDGSVSDDDWLRRTYEAIRSVARPSSGTISDGNRSVIRMGAQTLTTTILPMMDDEDEGEEERWEYEGRRGGSSAEKSLNFILSGYEGGIASMDAVLRNRAQTLLDRLIGLKHASTEASLSLQAQISGGQNPFLMFFLRDAAVGRVEDFQLRLRLSNPGVSVDVTSNSIDVGAQLPGVLVNAACKHLASPVLATQQSH